MEPKTLEELWSEPEPERTIWDSFRSEREYWQELLGPPEDFSEPDVDFGEED